MGNFALSQWLVIGVLLFDAASFQFKDRKKLLICLLCSSGLLSAHFFILDQSIGGALYLLTFCRFLAAAYFAKSQAILLIFLLATIGTSFFTYHSLISGFALVGSLSSTYGAFQRSDLRIRLFMLVGTISWLVFNVVIFSPMAVVRQLIFATSNLVGLWRFYKKEPTAS